MHLSLGGRRATMALLALTILGVGMAAMPGSGVQAAARPATTPAAAPAATPDAAPDVSSASSPAAVTPDTTTTDPWARYEVGFQPIAAVPLFDGHVARSALQRMQVTPVLGVPIVDVDAVALRVRVRGATTAGSVTVWGKNARPTNPTILISKAADRTQLVIVALPATGQVTLQPQLTAVDATVEVVGYVPNASSYTPIVPARAFDNVAAGAALTANSTQAITVTGLGGVPATGVAAVAVNVGLVSASVTTAVTLFPTGQTRPTTPDISAVATDRGISTTTIVPVGTDGKIQLYNAAGNTKLSVDVIGWFAAGGDYRPLARTSVRTGAATAGSTTLALGPTMPADTGAAVLVLRTKGSVSRSVTAYPTGTTRPTTPSLVTGAARNELLTVVPVGTDGSIDVHTTGALADLSVELLGTFARATLPPAGSSWQFDPTGWVSFTAGAQTQYSNLVNIGADGRPTGAFLPAGTSWAVAGDPSAVTVRVVGRGRVRVTSTDVIGSVNVVAVPPVGDQGQPLVAKNLRLRAGVQIVRDNRVLFPSTTAMGGGVPAPFTLAEVMARTSLPDDTTADPFNSGARVGLVLAGRAPAVGTVLAGVGGSGATGRVVAPAGLPSINRSGSSLITLEFVSPTDVYTDLRYEIDYATGAAVGSDGVVTATRVPLQTAFRKRPLAPVAASASAFGPRPAGTAVPDCRAEVNLVAKAEFKLLTIEAPEPKVTGNYREVLDGSVLHRFQVNMGIQWSGKAETSLTVQTEAQFKFECTLKDLASYDAPVADPRLATAAAEAKVIFAGEIVVPAGPRAELKYSCEWNIDKQFVISWNSSAPDELAVQRPSDIATSKCAPSADFTSTLLPRKVEAKLGIYANGGAGVRIFGKIAEFLGKVAGKQDLGVVEVLDMRYGPETKLDWETDQEVLRTGAAGSKVVTQIVAEGNLKMPSIQSLLSKFTVHVGIQPNVKLFEVVEPAVSWYRAPSSPTTTVTVNDGAVAAAGTITVYPGDQVRVESVMQYPNLGEQRTPDAPITGATDWIETSPQVWERFDGFTSTAGTPAPKLIATTTITPAMCQSLLDPHAIAFLPTTKMLDLSPTAGWAGKVTLQCGRPTLAFEPDHVSFRPFETGGAVRTVQLKSEHAKGMVWSFVNADDIPAWLTVSARAGGRFQADPDSVAIQLSVDCSQVPGTGASTVLNASVGDALGRSAAAFLSVSTDCQDEYIRVDPSNLTDGGSTNVITSGRSEDRWTLGPLPAWAKASVRFRDLEAGLSSGLVSFTIDRTPTCQVQPETRADVTFTTTNRGEAILTLVRTRIPAIVPCPTQQLKGDPHLVTADGVQFDAQVVGEYVTARSATGDFVLSVRQDATSSPGVGRPTSVTGVSILTDGATIEVYANRAPGNGRVFVNGEAVDIDPTVPLAVTDTVRIARQADANGVGADAYTVFGPDGVLLAEQHGSILDVTFAYAGARSDITGLLGSPDGDPSNDLVPQGATTGYTADEVRGHTPALYTLTDSWRTTDLADSMFTVPDDVFTALDWPMDDAALAPFRTQAFAALGSITNVCGGDRPGANDYVVDALALELSIGTPVGDLGRFTCNYIATANTLTAAGGYPVPGVQVTFDAPGLRPCTAVSTADGVATCRLVVDLDELAGATGPLTVTATAAWPDTPGTLATTTIPVIEKAPLDGTPLSIEGNLAIPVEVPQVTLSGTLRNDVAAPSPWSFQFLARDADGVIVGSNQVTVTPAADGSYSVTVPMPPRAVRVAVDVILADFTRDQHEVTGLVPGVTTPATLDVDDRVQHLRITGVMTYNGAPAVGTGTTRSTLAIDQRDGSGRLIGFQSVTPTVDPVTGAYVVEVDLISITRSVDLRAFVATDVPDRRVVVSTTVTAGLAAGATTSTTFDALATRGRVLISGTARQAGAPASDHYAVVQMYDADGVRLGGKSVFVDVDPVTGAYTLDPELVDGTVRISVRFQVGALASDNPILEVAGLSPGTTKNVPFDFDVGNRNLVVSGTARLGGEPAIAGTGLDITLTPYDSAGQPIVVTTPFGNAEFGNRPDVGANGAYQSPPIALPAGTVEVRGRVRIANVDTPFTAAITGGTNSVTVDLDTVQLVLHGRYELANDGTVFVTSAAPPTATLQGVGAFVVQPDGTYTVTLQFPVGTTDARVGIALQSESTVVTGLEPGTNDREFDWLAPDTVTVTGQVTHTYQPALDVSTVRLRVRSYHVNDDDTFVLLGEVQLDEVPVTNGLIDTPVPVSPGTTLVDIDAAAAGSDDWGRLGAYAVDPGGIVSNIQVELDTFVDITFGYTDIAPACSTKIRGIDWWRIPSDAGQLMFDGTGFPTPAVLMGSVLVVPGSDFTETLRVPVPGYWAIGVVSHARGDWANLPEPLSAFQTEPIIGTAGFGISTSRASYTCDGV